MKFDLSNFEPFSEKPSHFGRRRDAELKSAAAILYTDKASRFSITRDLYESLGSPTSVNIFLNMKGDTRMMFICRGKQKHTRYPIKPGVNRYVNRAFITDSRALTEYLACFGVIQPEKQVFFKGFYDRDSDRLYFDLTRPVDKSEV